MTLETQLFCVLFLKCQIYDIEIYEMKKIPNNLGYSGLYLIYCVHKPGLPKGKWNYLYTITLDQNIIELFMALCAHLLFQL